MTEARYATIEYGVEDRVATITLDRPDALNTYNMQMMHDLIDAFDRVDGDDQVRAVVVTGRGRAFCAGADLVSGERTFDASDYGTAQRPEDHRDEGGRLTLRIAECLKPVIAAVNGPAVGVGATMLLPMDVRLASRTARFGFVFTRRGIVPEACSSWFLPRVVSMPQALEWMITGRVFDADEALRGGLVRSVHAPGELLDVARSLAREIADHTSPVSVALARRMLLENSSMRSPFDAHLVESRLMFERGRSEDVREGVRSFLEKRLPAFPQRVSTDLEVLLRHLRGAPCREVDGSGART